MDYYFPFVFAHLKDHGRTSCRAQKEISKFSIIKINLLFLIKKTSLIPWYKRFFEQSDGIHKNKKRSLTLQKNDKNCSQTNTSRASCSEGRSDESNRRQASYSTILYQQIDATAACSTRNTESLLDSGLFYQTAVFQPWRPMRIEHVTKGILPSLTSH
ncbi:hypothetical protein ACPF7Z_10185 [Halomonas sp. GXIMD04776]|uniref:hypothetical protein n=1 Tax=Halomonas sp. GXIMD04776 TaxID=3415605 RepID=UPI003C8789D1